VKQAITSDERNLLMLVEYDDLAKNPEKILRAIYNFIDEPWFEHDFNDVEASWDEYDMEIGITLHKVRKKVEYITRKTILPPDIQHKFSNMEVWRM
jgi:sulfotransferase